MSSKVIDIKRVEETSLWKKLEALNDPSVKTLIAAVKLLCEDASDRIKAMPTLCPQYTLHDESHFLRVTEIMGIILGSTIEQLNAAELCLLILAAYYHDQGMLMEESEYSQLSENSDFKVFRENWYIDHPNQQEISSHLRKPNLSNREQHRLSNLLVELDAAMITDYLRITHAKRSAELIIHRTYA